MTVIYDISGAVAPLYDTEGRLIFGTRDVIPVDPPDGPTLNVITDAATMNSPRTPSSADGVFAGTVHRTVVDVDQPVLEWRGGGRTSDAGGVMRAAIRVGNGPWRNITFDGETTATLPALTGGGTAYVRSDPAPITAHAGDAISILAWADSDGGAGESIPADSIQFPSLGVGVGSWTTQPTLREAAHGDWSLRPSALLAPSDQPSWLVSGDSNADGSGSFTEVAMQAIGVAWIKSTQGGRPIPTPDGGVWNSLVAPHLGKFTHFLDQYGGNNAAPGRGWEEVGPLYLGAWQALRDAGVTDIVKTTITVSAGTTDNWATLEGQTPTDHAQSRWDISQWLLAGAPYIDGTPVAPGTAGATTCRVVQDDGTVTPGNGDHLVSGVSDVRQEHPDDPLRWSPEAMALMAAVNHRDGLHAPATVHALSAQRLVRDMRALGY